MTGAQTILKFIISTFILLLTLATTADVFAIDYPNKPIAKNKFVIDKANIISDADETLINSISLNLRNQKSIPIVVVTIDSLAQYDAEDLSIEAYSRALFDNWGIGRSQYNYGMLLLVSKNDRKARIELGADWAGKANQDATYVMNKIIIKHFRLDKFSEGIREGTMGLDAIARGSSLPSPYYPQWVTILIYIILSALIGVCTLIGISLIKSGKKGLGWAFLGMAGVFLYYLLDYILSPQSGGYSDGGFSGGGPSGGGGSSGGGGASGSW